MTTKKSEPQAKCVQCRRAASVSYQGKWYCRTCINGLLGIKAGRRPQPKPKGKKR